MSLTTGEMSAADLAAVVGNSNNGFGGFGGDGGWWIILLFLVLFGGNGWGNGIGGNSGAGALYPWLNQTDNINTGFRDQMLNSNIAAIQQGVNGLSTQLCSCCGDMQMALANGFAGAEIAANGRGIYSRRGYSYDSDKEEKVDMLRSMMSEVHTDDERRALQKIIRRMETE